MQQKILLVDTMHESFTTLLQQSGFIVENAYSLSREEIIKILPQYNGLAIRSRFFLDDAFFQHASSLKFIARAGAGMENIDTRAAAARGITCLNAPEGNRDAVAEHATGMLLSLFNHLERADAEVRKGIWKREENRGTELQGKTVAIIGFGNMGSAFAKRMQGFDVNILAYDKYKKIDAAGFPYVKQCSEAEVFAAADVISLHLPLTPETTYYVNDQYLHSFLKPVWIVNTARGKNIDTAALVDALKDGRVKGAALDVIEYESLSFEQLNAAALPAPFAYLLDSGKVLLSPHIAGWTHESNEKIARVLVQKILAIQ